MDTPLPLTGRRTVRGRILRFKTRTGSVPVGLVLELDPLAPLESAFAKIDPDGDASMAGMNYGSLVLMDQLAAGNPLDKLVIPGPYAEAFELEAPSAVVIPDDANDTLQYAMSEYVLGNSFYEERTAKIGVNPGRKAAAA
jgi:hypothetical protein